MDIKEIYQVIECNYDVSIHNIELFREGGNYSYVIYDAGNKYFLKIVRPPYLETALVSMDIQMYLYRSGFSVIPIISTKDGASHVLTKKQGIEYVFILYDYIQGGEPDPEDTEEVGALIGKLHQVMKNYPGQMLVRDKHFFIDRYVNIMRKMQYPKTEWFCAFGNELWEKVKNLPRGYCHCDLYDGNIHKSSNKFMYVVDFDTSCIAFPIYDAVLFCNRTHYFEFDISGYEKTKARLERFLLGYMRHCQFSKEELAVFYDLIAVYHFQLPATKIETHGYDANTTKFFDKQYDWLNRWKKQCEEMNNL